MKLRKIIAAAGVSVLLAGCSAREPYSLEIYSMNTLMSLKAYGDSAEDALTEISARMNELEQELSVTITDSDVGRINSAGGNPVEVGDDAAEIISTALEFSQRTDGALDITIYPVVKAWGFTTGEHRVPDSDELAKLLERTDYTKVEISGNTVTIPDGFEIDLGALAKGYAGDCAAEILQKYGCSSAILNLGGNVCAIGSKPDGSPWKVAVTDPEDTSAYLGVVTASDKFIVTSGKYERCFTADDGKTYHHIIDPETGCPSDNGVAQVTVMGTSGIECDALSTALLVMGADKAYEYRKEYGDFDMLIAMDDGSLFATPGFAESFTAEEGHSVTVIE